MEYYSKKPASPKYKSKHKLPPKWTFTIVISGHNVRGKTSILFNLIFKYLYFSRFYVDARIINEPYYEYMQEVDNEWRESLGKEYYDYLNIYNFLYDVVPLQDNDSGTQNLVVFDDLIIEKDQSNISDYITMGRKYHSSVIYTSESYYNTPRKIRLNTSYFALYNPRNKQELSQFKKEIPLSISNEELVNILEEATSQKCNFWFIDKVTTADKLMYRISLGYKKE